MPILKTISYEKHYPDYGNNISQNLGSPAASHPEKMKSECQRRVAVVLGGQDHIN